MRIEINVENAYDAKHHMECVWNCIVRQKERETFKLRRLTVHVEKTTAGYLSTEEKAEALNG